MEQTTFDIRLTQNSLKFPTSIFHLYRNICTWTRILLCSGIRFSNVFPESMDALKSHKIYIFFTFKNLFTFMIICNSFIF